MEEGALAENIEGVQDSFGLVKEKLDGWLETLVALLPNLVVAFIVVFIFGLLAKLARSLSRRFLEKVTGSRAIARLLSTLSGITVVFIGIFIALGVLQLDKTVTSLLAGAGVVGIALAFAFQDLAANLIAGVYLSFQRPFVMGDLVETNDVFGTVSAIDLRTTVIKTNDGQTVLLPNREIFEGKLVNFSKSQTRRVSISVGVSYGEDLETVRQLTLEALSNLELRDSRRDVEVFFEGFGASSIDLAARFWIDFHRQAEYKHAVSEAMLVIKKAYDANGIVIPFPIRTLDFGIKGGLGLSDALPKQDTAEQGTVEQEIVFQDTVD